MLKEGTVILSVEWKQQVAYLRILEDGDVKLIELKGVQMGFDDSSSTGLCIGRMTSKGVYDPCREPVVPKKKKCKKCLGIEARNVGVHHVHTKGLGSVSKKVQTKLDQMHCLYLAGFRDGTIKVGTSVGHRLNDRLAEQGAWQAIKVAEVSNGVLVRTAEDAVTESLGLTQQVRMTRKMKGFLEPIEDDLLKEKLSSYFESIKTEIDWDNVDLKGSIIALPWDSTQWENVIKYPHDIKQGSHSFSILGACGKHAVIESLGLDGVKMLLDLNQLIGLATQKVEKVSQIEIQSSLF